MKIRLASGAEIVCENAEELRIALRIVEESGDSPLLKRTSLANAKRAVGQRERWARARELAKEKNITIGEARALAAKEEKLRQATEVLGLSNEVTVEVVRKSDKAKKPKV